MAEKVGDAYVELGTRDQALTAGLSGGLRAVRGFAIAASSIFAGVAAGRGISGLVGAYSDAIETTNKFNEVFSGAAQDINKVADDLAAGYGLISTSSRKLLADTGDILVGFGFAEDAALDLAKTTNQLAIDLASFTNIEGGAARASQALTKALVGETEQAKALGIVIRQNSAEFKGIVKRLIDTEGKTILQAKALAALEIAFSQTKKAQGDYARTADQLANQMRMTGECMTEVKEALGGLVVRFTSVDGKIISLNESLSKLAQKLRDVDTATLNTAKAVSKAVFQVGALLLVSSKLTPALTAVAGSIAAIAAKGGLGAALFGGAGAVAAVAGISAIIVAMVKWRKATEDLAESMNNAADQRAKLFKETGLNQTGPAFKAISKAIKENDVKRISELRVSFPTAVENMLEAFRDSQRAKTTGKKDEKTVAASQQQRSFAFTSFDDAIRNIQTSLGKGDEDKKQTNLLGNIDKGIQMLVKKPEAAIVGV